MAEITGRFSWSDVSDDTHVAVVFGATAECLRGLGSIRNLSKWCAMRKLARRMCSGFVRCATALPAVAHLSAGPPLPGGCPFGFWGVQIRATLTRPTANGFVSLVHI